MIIEWWINFGRKLQNILLGENSGSKRKKEFHEYKSNEVKTDNFIQESVFYMKLANEDILT